MGMDLLYDAPPTLPSTSRRRRNSQGPIRGPRLSLEHTALARPYLDMVLDGTTRDKLLVRLARDVLGKVSLEIRREIAAKSFTKISESELEAVETISTDRLRSIAWFILDKEMPFEGGKNGGADLCDERVWASSVEYRSTGIPLGIIDSFDLDMHLAKKHGWEWPTREDHLRAYQFDQRYAEGLRSA